MLAVAIRPLSPESIYRGTGAVAERPLWLSCTTVGHPGAIRPEFAFARSRHQQGWHTVFPVKAPLVFPFSKPRHQRALTQRCNELRHAFRQKA